jgi:hypothetical protein
LERVVFEVEDHDVIMVNEKVVRLTGHCVGVVEDVVDWYVEE